MSIILFVSWFAQENCYLQRNSDCGEGGLKKKNRETTLIAASSRFPNEKDKG